MAILKCKMCGGDLEVLEGMTVCECEYCGTKQTVPTIDDEKKAKLFDRANKLRLNCEFDKAAGVYENIVADYPEEAEGFWGLVLCRYGIEYVDDPVAEKKIPTCHRSSFDSIMDDEDFEMVMENSDAYSRVVYREEAKYIEEIRKGIIEVSGKEDPYDIFICYKETDENGERTLDSVLAQDVYDELTSKGYRVFFSRISLEDKLGVEYEPYIFAALNSAKIMLAFGTSYDYYNAVWVKNEWSRYLKLMSKDKTKHLIPCFKNVDAYDIPKEFAKLQSQDMGKIGAIQDLMRGIDKLIAPISKNEKNIPTENFVYNNSGANEIAILKRGFMAIEDNEWTKATDFLEQVLNINAEAGQAYWGKLLVQYMCNDAEMLGKKLLAEMLSKVKSEQHAIEIEDRYELYKSKYFIMDFFSEEEIKRLFRSDFYYESSVSSIEGLIEQNKKDFVLNENKLYQRTKQYANNSVKSNLEILEQIVETGLAETKSKIISNEKVEIDKAVDKANAYYGKLEDSLYKASSLAQENLDRRVAEFQTDHDLWEKERDIYIVKHAEWEKEALAKQRERELWTKTNKSVLDVWYAENRAYKESRERLEAQVKHLQDELILIEGFAAEARKASINKKIMSIRIKLSQLNMPAEPKLQNAPIIPPEVTLRDEPARASLDVLIEKDSVIRFFYASMRD